MPMSHNLSQNVEAEEAFPPHSMRPPIPKPGKDLKEMKTIDQYL